MSEFRTPEPMSERRRTYMRLIAEVGVSIVGVVALALLGGPVVGILMPFILAFIMAWMFNPVIAWLQRHLRLTRRLFSYILVLVFYALLFGICLFFAGQLVSQAIDLARNVPTFIAQLQDLYNQLITWLEEILTKLPAEYAGVGDELFSLLASAWEWLKTLLSGALSYAMSMTRNIALEVPSFVIFLTVLVLASCIITADFPNLRENIYGYLGVRGKNSVRLMGHSFRAAVFGFFRSQLIFALLIFGFTFFYSTISFNPVEISKNIQQNGGMIPGIRQGRPTSDFIAKTVRRITLFGAIYLALLATIPAIFYGLVKVSLPFAASSLLIAVSVAMETTRQLESQMTMRHYKGFLK
mgnify:CR=1 FL=1